MFKLFIFNFDNCFIKRQFLLLATIINIGVFG